MGTLLKVLNVFILVFAAAACFFAYGNFGKLKESAERAEKLKDAVISLGTTLEAAEPSFDGVANHTAWDIDDVSERPVDAPTTDDFWDSYLDQYELAANETLNLGRKRDQLGQLYSIDPASNKPRKGADGKNLTTGKGTMQDLLDDTVQRAKEQYSLLNKTRQQLIEVREKLDDVAGMLNSEKRARRDALAQVAQFRSAAEAVQAQLAQKDSLVAQANREKTDLEDQIADLRSVIDQKDQEIANKDTEIARVKEEVLRLSVDGGATSGGKRTAAGAAAGESGPVALAAGVKGVVRKVEREWGFVIVELTPEAAEEVRASGAFSPVEMMVRRKSAAGEKIVTRIQVTTPPNERNMAVADNMYGWEQTPVKPGDEVVY